MSDYLSATIDPPVWRRRWFQILLGVLLSLLVATAIIPPILAVLYAARSVLTPVVIALALAYIFNPLVCWLHDRFKLPRAVSAVLILSLAVILILGLVAYLTPKVVSQTEEFAGKLATYAEQLQERDEVRAIGDYMQRKLEEFVATSEGAEGASGTLQSLDYAALMKGMSNVLGAGTNVVTGTIGFGSYVVLAAVVIAFCFFFFTWKFQPVLDFFVPFIPQTYRAQTLELLGEMDQTVSGFIRGRLVQASVFAVVLSVGWWWAGVPYWLLLGVAGGLLNLVPFAAVVVWPIAVVLAWLDSLSGGAAGEAAGAVVAFDYMKVLVWPSVVYFVAQGLDGWVVEPLVQGEVTGLDPLTVMLCVLIGGSLLGLLGMLIAIPATACIKILLKRAVLPKMRELAAEA